MRGNSCVVGWACISVETRSSRLLNRQIVLDKVEDDEDEPRGAKVHNSLTKDGISMPVLPKAKRAIEASAERSRKLAEAVSTKKVGSPARVAAPPPTDLLGVWKHGSAHCICRILRPT